MFKCIKSFAGNTVSMKKGDTIEHLDKALAEDYLRAGFIIEEKAEEVKTEVKEVVEEVKEAAEKTASKRTTRRKK